MGGVILQPKCDQCPKKQLLQRSACHACSNAVPPVVHDVLRSLGAPLDPATRAFMEQRLGHDFSRVRVHSDAKAAESARAVNALAYTVGRDVVLGSGPHSPQSRAGLGLMAHELAHVVQQGPQEPALQTLTMGSQEGADEHEAEMASHQMLSGRPVSVPLRSSICLVQRKMLNKVETDFQNGAKACVVHLHGEEGTALGVAREIRSRRCVNFVHLDTTDRWVDLEIDVGTEKHSCKADPNRVFSDKGRHNDALAVIGCRLAKGSGARTDSLAKDAAKMPSPAKASRSDVTDAAAAELETFVNSEWGKKISECRGGDGSSVQNGTLPTLALHNNEALNLSEYEKAKDVTRVPQGVANPTFGDPTHKSDFFFVTQLADFDALREPGAKANVFLQADPVLAKGQDGSLSVALQSQRFINVEKEGRKHDKPVKKGGRFTGPDDIYVRNYAMAAQALDLFGVPDGPCVIPPSAQPGSGSAAGSPQPPSARTATILATDKPLLGKDVPVGETRELNPFGESLPQSGEPKRLGSTLPYREATELVECIRIMGEANAAYCRQTVLGEPPPAPIRATMDSFVANGCIFFFNQSGLDERRDEWQQKLGRMPLQSIINWMLGVDKAFQPPEAAVALKEVTAQRDCMIKAMEKSLSAAGLSLPKGDLNRSEVRPFSEQESIWTRKFRFTGAKFGHISSAARARCAADNLLDAADVEWDPSKPKHRTCWLKLSSEEKEMEILMTSSAPGVSRHHTGTDFDIGRKGRAGEKDLTAEAWTGSGDFADAYRWLAPNAATYGFIQPFDTKGGYGTGYATERWHWSYYPIAQALLEFARSHRSEIGDELKRQWSDSTSKAPRPEFKFIWDNWERYMFNVEEKGIF